MKSRIPHDRLSQRWWRDWWSEDFSWTALASKPIGSQQADVILGATDGSKNLQDYWRRGASNRLRTDAEMLDAGELVRESNGRLWHLCHVPLAWRDGTPAKSAWGDAERARLRELIEARLEVTAPSQFFFNGQRTQNADGRAQLSGTIFCEPPSAPKSGVLRIRAEFAWIPAWDAGSVKFGAGANFSRALFEGRLKVNCATFEGALSFDGARLMGDVTLGSVPDSRGAQFSDEVSARKAIFLGNAEFSRCGFNNGARFDGARFTGEVDFFAATLAGSVGFDHGVFDARVSFMSAELQSLSFSSVRCNGFADFSAAKFSSNSWLYFRHCDFRDGANFSGTKFSRKPEALVGGFSGARFRKTPDFEGAGLYWISALDEIILEQGIRIDKFGAPFLERQFTERLLPAALKVPKEYEDAIPRERLRQLLALQGGCRTLRVEMERTGNATLAQTFASFERRIDDEVRHLPVPPDPMDS